MKKFAISILTAGLLISSSLYAQEKAGGTYSSDYGVGQMTLPQIVAAATAAALAASAIANSSGNGKSVAPPGPQECDAGFEDLGAGCVPIVVYSCLNDDELVDGVCIGNATTVTVTASGTGTTTINVPVTFTYPAIAN